MILTIAAWTEEMLLNWSKSVSQSVHLNEQFPILLYVLVGELHLLPLLRLHRNVDVHLVGRVKTVLTQKIISTLNDLGSHPQFLVLVPMEEGHSGV